MYSTTQASNVAVFAGAISIILSKAGYEVTSGELQTILGALVLIAGVAYNWYHRYAKGDVTPLGFRK